MLTKNIGENLNPLASIDQKTNNVGKNRFEILLFNMGTDQKFGINVFKVKEVIRAMELSEMPGSHEHVLGIANIRGATIPVIDLRAATGLGQQEVSGDGLYIVTEYNRQKQAFLVSTVDRIVNVNWADISEPPSTLGGTTYITSITKIEERIIGIVDVERVLGEIAPPTKIDAEDSIVARVKSEGVVDKNVLLVDDSAVARKQMERAIGKLGFTFKSFVNGKVALEHLKSIVAEGKSVSDVYDVIISDIEMPEMDGYTLTSEIKSTPKMADVPLILHTSMSGVFNETLVKNVGADKFIAKFDPDQLSEAVIEMATLGER